MACSEKKANSLGLFLPLSKDIDRVTGREAADLHLGTVYKAMYQGQLTARQKGGGKEGQVSCLFGVSREKGDKNAVWGAIDWFRGLKEADGPTKRAKCAQSPL